MSTSPRHVADLVDTATGWGRRLIQGICKYAKQHRHWHLWVEPLGQNEIHRVPPGWRGHGVIARVHTLALAEHLQSLDVPVVNVSSIELPGSDFPRITTNHDASARLAAEHLIERGYRRFAYVGPVHQAAAKAHYEAFRNALTARGDTCDLFHWRVSAGPDKDWAIQRRELFDWLRTLPRPLGVFSWATSAGAHVIDACRSLGIIVPDDMAILAGDDDPLLCDATSPSMSGVVVASEQIGFRAALKLDSMMQGTGPGQLNEKLDPIVVHARGSTDTLAIQDPDLRKALTYLRQHLTDPITVADIADAVPMSRRTLERKFHQIFGRSPAHEIRRLRLMRVRELLIWTDLSIEQVALSTGFGTPEYMCTVFKAVEGITPLRYRRASAPR